MTHFNYAGSRLCLHAHIEWTHHHQSHTNQTEATTGALFSSVGFTLFRSHSCVDVLPRKGWACHVLLWRLRDVRDENMQAKDHCWNKYRGRYLCQERSTIADSIKADMFWWPLLFTIKLFLVQLLQQNLWMEEFAWHMTYRCEWLHFPCCFRHCHSLRSHDFMK